MRGDGSTLRILGPVERCLLAVLTLHLGEAVSQDQLAEALWGEHAPRSAANALQNYVLRLRRALQHADGVHIVTDPTGYRLEAPADAVDARLAERLIAEGREAAASGDLAAASRLLREALALWRGRALAEFSDQPFAQAEAARLEELRESAREDLADAELALGHHHDLVGELEAMVASHPLRERRWGQLLLARYRDERQAEALDGFRALRTTLRDELGVDPGPELQTSTTGSSSRIRPSPGGRPSRRQARWTRPAMAATTSCTGCWRSTRRPRPAAPGWRWFLARPGSARPDCSRSSRRPPPAGRAGVVGALPGGCLGASLPGVRRGHHRLCRAGRRRQAAG
jgi:DNA-binding SARP family transcriptional activator